MTANFSFSMQCYQRDGDDGYVPGCQGTPSHNTDYCVDPGAAVPTESPVEPPTDPPTSSCDYEVLTFVGDGLDYPLGCCEGDCDSDSQCSDGLM